MSFFFFFLPRSGILYLNDDFQGGSLFFTEMDTVTVTVSLGPAKKKEGGRGVRLSLGRRKLAGYWIPPFQKQSSAGAVADSNRGS